MLTCRGVMLFYWTEIYLNFPSNFPSITCDSKDEFEGEMSIVVIGLNLKSLFYLLCDCHHRISVKLELKLSRPCAADQLDKISCCNFICPPRVIFSLGTQKTDRTIWVQRDKTIRHFAASVTAHFDSFVETRVRYHPWLLLNRHCSVVYTLRAPCRNTSRSQASGCTNTVSLC